MAPREHLFRNDTVMFYRRTHTSTQFSYCLSQSDVNTPLLFPTTIVGGRMDGREGKGKGGEGELTTKPA